LKAYRDKKNVDFHLNEVLLALFTRKGEQVAVFSEVAENDFMSTLGITSGVLQKGKYTLLLQCDSGNAIEVDSAFSEVALTIYKSGITVVQDEELELKEKECEEAHEEQIEAVEEYASKKPSDWV